MPVTFPPAGRMSKHFHVMRRPKSSQDQGTQVGKSKAIANFDAQMETIASREYEQLRKTFDRATSVVECFWFDGLRSSDVLFDQDRGKRYEIVGLENVDEEDELWRIAVTELTK